MVWLVISSMVLTAAYVAAVCIKNKGVPASISATFYTLGHKAWFLVAMWGTAGLLMPVLLEVSKPGTEWMAFAACAGMFLVGAAPNFKDGFEGKAHAAGAVLCLSGSQLWAMLNCPWALTIWAVCLLGTLEEMRRGKSFLETKPMFWAEAFAFMTVFISLYIII